MVLIIKFYRKLSNLMIRDIRLAMENVQRGIDKAKMCPFRPRYHFLPPAYWMNDPNGLIFYEGEYHIFYQHNPFKDNFKQKEWWEMCWGHTKSSDLVHWEHLSIAIIPSHENGEDGCWSGACVINNGIPTIIYTSASKNTSPHEYAEQWMAISRDGMRTWEKSVNNPILTSRDNSPYEIHDWRDPYIWKENGKWYMILGGHEHKSPSNSHGIVLIYESSDLIKWHLKGILCRGNRTQGRGWECPNLFSLGEDHVLIVSPFKKVIYSIGKYEKFKFLPGIWNIFDHGKCLYAVNTMLDDKNRRIAWGWIKGGGSGGWNGCLSLPRILNFDSNNYLSMNPANELQKLRKSHLAFENLQIPEGSQYFLGDYPELSLEIIAQLDLSGNEIFGFGLFLDELNVGEKLEFDTRESKISLGNENGRLNHQESNKDFIFHIFIDRSVIEVFINYHDCITSRIFPKTNMSNGFTIFSKRGSINLKKIEIWTIETIS